jgi:hypothetical protein
MSFSTTADLIVTSVQTPSFNDTDRDCFNYNDAGEAVQGSGRNTAPFLQVPASDRKALSPDVRPQYSFFNLPAEVRIRIHGDPLFVCLVASLAREVRELRAIMQRQTSFVCTANIHVKMHCEDISFKYS